MVEDSQYVKDALAKMETLLFTRALTSKHKKINDKVVAKGMHVTPRQVRRYLAQAERYLEKLLPYILAQPEIRLCNQHSDKDPEELTYTISHDFVARTQDEMMRESGLGKLLEEAEGRKHAEHAHI